MDLLAIREADDLGHGIRCIDTLQDRPKLACCYLIEHQGEAALIECGTSPGVSGLLATIESLGLRRERIRYLIPTHVHLDHAGGAGLLMRELPRAKLVVHPRGARHLIDPSKLVAGATAVYGAEAVRKMYGDILPIEASRVIEAADGDRVALGDRELLFVDTPGHARHHFSVWDAQSRGFFTGDTFGLSYCAFDGPQGPYLMPTTTPVQFEPDAWEQTIDRYLSFDPQRMYLTHYGCVENVAQLANDLRRGLQDYQDLARGVANGEARHQALAAALLDYSLKALRDKQAPTTEAFAREWLAMDMDLNAQGLEVWLDKAA